MNLTVLLIAVYLPLPVVLFMILRSGSFGKGSIGTMMKLFFLGVLSAVPAFLMEAGGLFVMSVFMRLFPDQSFGGNLPVISALLRYLVVVALIEEGWKHFVLRVSTWKQMTMETVADGVAASALVGTGFSAVMYGAWLAAFYMVPADMEVLRNAMPDFLMAGTVTSFLFAILFVFSHFGFSGFMGAIYGLAKNSEQKDHAKRAGFMLFISCLLPVMVHGLCAGLIGYGIAKEKLIWFGVGLALQVLLAILMAAALSNASDAAGAVPQYGYEDKPVDFADSEEFASFAESSGTVDDYLKDEGDGSGSSPVPDTAAEVDMAGDTGASAVPGLSDAAGTADDSTFGSAETSGSDQASDKPPGKAGLSEASWLDK